MIKKFKYNGKIIALVLKREDDLKKGINFLSGPENSFQVGVLSHPKGHVIQGHIHNFIERKILDTQEMLYVESGKMKINFFNDQGKKIGEDILEPGDLVNFMSEGHGMEILEDSKIIYVKQGPYAGKDADKRVF